VKAGRRSARATCRHCPRINRSWATEYHTRWQQRDGFIVQVETSLSLTASPGLRTYYTQQSNVVTAQLAWGHFVGLQGNSWGKVKIGTTYSPYKKSTDAMTRFSGMLGDYAVIMGNSGGDNRGRVGHPGSLDLVRITEVFNNIFSFDVLCRRVQNPHQDNVVQSAGSPDCNGGNPTRQRHLDQLSSLLRLRFRRVA